MNNIVVKNFSVKVSGIAGALADVQRYVKKDFLSDQALKLLAGSLSSDITLLRVEEPYVDKDFRDLFYRDFSKRFREVCRNSKRVHVYSDGDYLGFFTLHGVAPFNIGRSYLAPRAVGSRVHGYMCLSTYHVNFCGEDLTVNAFPWMQQDVNMSRCAHVAIWEVIRYFSQRRSNYSEVLLGEIDDAGDDFRRKVPSNGLTLTDIAACLCDHGFAVNIHSREAIGKKIGTFDFNQLIFAYIESGIPVVAVFSNRPHAVAVMGHGKVDVAAAAGYRDAVIPSYRLCGGLVSCDDNKMPYSELPTGVGEAAWKISHIVAPLYEKMYVDLFTFMIDIVPEFEREFLDRSQGKQYIRRVFITSSNAFKRFVFRESGDEEYIKYTGRLLMPKFVVVAEYSLKDEFPGFIRYRLLFDATSFERQSFKDNYICMKVQKKLMVNGIGHALDLVRETEPVYVNNLIEEK